VLVGDLRMKVSLVYPGGTPTFYPPLGILSIGTFLREDGIDVDIFDVSFQGLRNFRDHMRDKDPDVVGVSCLTPIAQRAFRVATIAKDHSPGCTVVFGGPHATALPEDTLEHPKIDLVIVGEGEMTFRDLILALKKGDDVSSVNGIYYKDGNIVRKTAPRPPISDLDILPIPDRTLLPTFKNNLRIRPPYPMGSPCTPVMFSRGCPYGCSFCQPLLRRIFGNKVRFRSPVRAVDELEYLIDEFRVRYIWFSDDTLTVNRGWAESLCHEIIRRRLHKRFKWFAQTRVNLFDPYIAKLMKEAGCIYVAFGVESGSQKILDKVLNKGIKTDQARQAFRVCHDVGLLTEAALIVGCPEDSRATIGETIRIVGEIRPDVVDVHYLTPMPGSALYEQLRTRLAYSGAWDSLDRYKPGAIELDGLTKQDLEQLYREIFRNFHRYKSIRKSVISWLKYSLNSALTYGFKRGVRTFVWAVLNRDPLNPTLFLQENWRLGGLFRLFLLPLFVVQKLRRRSKAT